MNQVNAPVLERSGQAGRVSRLKAIVTGTTARSSYFSIFDHGLLSGTNFLAAFLLARFTAREEFGAYILAFSALQVLLGLQRSLLLGAMTVLGTPKEGEEFRRFISTNLLAQVGLGLGLVVVMAGITLVIDRFWPGVSGAFWGLNVGLFFTLFQEYVRRVLFTRLQSERVLANDTIFCGLRIGGAALLLLPFFLTGLPWGRGLLTARNFFLIQAVAALAASLYGWYQIRGYLIRRPRLDRGHLRENWEFGRWALGNFIAASLEGNAMNFIVAAYAGAAGTAVLEAPRLILAPLQVLFMAGHSVLTPKFSEKFGRQGSQGLRLYVPLASAFWGGIFVLYAALILAAPKFWLELFYGSRYEGNLEILVLWAVIYAIIGLKMIPQIGIMAVRRPDIAMYIGMAMGGVTLVLCLWLASGYGATGAVIARVAGEVVSMVLSLYYCARLLSRDSAPGAAKPEADR